MKKEIWDWLPQKLCRTSGKSSVINSLQTGRHAHSSAQGFEHIQNRRRSTNTVGMNTNNARRASTFSPFGVWPDSGRMSGIDVDVDVGETEAVSGGLETESLLIGVLGGLDDKNGVEESSANRPSFDIQGDHVADRTSFDIQEDHVDENKLPHDLPNRIIQSLQPSDNGDRIKEIYCRFGFLMDYLISRRKHRHDAFNVFDGREKNAESALDLLGANRSVVGRLKKLCGRKTSLHFEQAKLDKKVKRVFLKKIHDKFETKKSDGCLHSRSKELLVSEALEIASMVQHCKLGSTCEQERRNSSAAESNGDRTVSAPTKKEEVYSQRDADYRITTDTDCRVFTKFQAVRAH